MQADSDAAAVLGRTDAFWGFPAEVLGRLAARGKRHVFAPSEVLYHQGEALAFCYLILRGRVALQRRHRDGIDPAIWAERLVSEIVPYFPLDHDPSPDTAVATEQTEVLVLTDPPIVEAVLALPELAEESLAFLSGRVRSLHQLRALAAAEAAQPFAHRRARTARSLPTVADAR